MWATLRVGAGDCTCGHVCGDRTCARDRACVCVRVGMSAIPCAGAASSSALSPVQ